jgi:tetratricopeptide (TPR) repeat protein
MTQGDVETFRHIGFFLAVQGRLAQALSAFDLVLREQPTNTDVILARGIVLQEMGQHAAATRFFRAALALDADCGVAWELLGNTLLFAEGDPPAALAAYERATALNPVRASSYHGKGMALSRCGRKSEALAAFELAVWLDPYEPRYRESLRALQAEYSFFEPSGQGPAWGQFTENSRLFCEWLIACLDELIAQRGGPAPAGEEILSIPLDTPEASRQLAGATALARAFLEQWSSRRARRRHPLRALRYWWVESQVRRRQAKGRKAVLLRLVAAYRRFHLERGDFFAPRRRPGGPAGWLVRARTGWRHPIPVRWQGSSPRVPVRRGGAQAHRDLGVHRLHSPVLFGLCLLAILISLLLLHRLRGRPPGGFPTENEKG